MHKIIPSEDHEEKRRGSSEFVHVLMRALGRLPLPGQGGARSQGQDRADHQHTEQNDESVGDGGEKRLEVFLGIHNYLLAGQRGQTAMNTIAECLQAGNEGFRPDF